MFDENLLAIGKKLAEYCQTEQTYKGLEELYADDAVSVEALDMDGNGREIHGREGIKGKHDWWFQAHDVHSSSTEGPFLHGANQFGLIFEMDVTTKETGERMQARELGVYTVENGKIVREEFFYATP